MPSPRSTPGTKPGGRLTLWPESNKLIYPSEFHEKRKFFAYRISPPKITNNEEESNFMVNRIATEPQKKQFQRCRDTISSSKKFVIYQTF
jgi:hypothetical protein